MQTKEFDAQTTIKELISNLDQSEEMKVICLDCNSSKQDYSFLGEKNKITSLDDLAINPLRIPKGLSSQEWERILTECLVHTEGLLRKGYEVLHNLFAQIYKIPEPGKMDISPQKDVAFSDLIEELQRSFINSSIAIEKNLSKSA